MTIQYLIDNYKSFDESDIVCNTNTLNSLQSECEKTKIYKNTIYEYVIKNNDKITLLLTISEPNNTLRIIDRTNDQYIIFERKIKIKN